MIKNILFFYSLLLAIFISVSGFLGSKKPETINFQIIFLPVILYFFIKFLMVIRKKEGPSGNLGAGVVFFSIIVLIVLTGTSINRIFFAKKDIEQKPAMIQTASPSPTPKENIKRIIIIIEDNSPTVNIRSKATIYSEIIKKVEKDNTFDVLEEEKEWFKIKLDEKTDGYVSKKYAKLVKDE